VSDIRLLFEVDIPAGWHQLPSANGPEATNDAIARIAGVIGASGETRDRLVQALAAVTAIAQSPIRGGRTHWAFVPVPSSGRVEALMSLGRIASSSAEADAYRDAASVNLDGPDPDPTNPAELVNRTVTEHALPVGRAIAIHDFVIEPTRGGVPDPAVERAIVALFPDRAARGIEMSIVTQNLVWFEDITGYLVDIASTFRETEVRSA
jgi:hypothetical protein